MTKLPKMITSGDTVSWDVTVPDYLSTAWTLTYYFAHAAETPIPVVAEGNADGTYTLKMTPAVSSRFLVAADYHYTARVSDGTDTYTVARGTVGVKPNPTLPHDTRSHWEIGLAAVKAVLENRLSDPAVDYEIDGLKVRNIPHADLLKLYALYSAAVRRGKGKPGFRNVLDVPPAAVFAVRGGR